MTVSPPGSGGRRAAGNHVDIPGISIFHAIVFHSSYPPAAGAVYLLLTLFGLLLVTFALSALSPVDRVLQIVGDHASQSTYDQVRHQLGLDQPLPVQFWHYLVNLSHGDLGIASATGQPVLHDLLAVFPATLSWRPWR
jgi:ABC-type dipeptide/oligopeptide/nickel transport system permease component